MWLSCLLGTRWTGRWAALGALAMSLAVGAEPQAAGSLQELLQSLRSARVEAARHNQEREARFLSERDQQSALLDQARERLAAAQARSEALKARYDANETELAELETDLEQSQGDLGEMFGVVRQVAGDLASMLQSSLVSAQLPESRLEFMEGLAESDVLPSMTKLERLWLIATEEMTRSGEVARFPATVYRADGTAYDTEVVRAGVFNAIVDDRYLQFLPENRQLMELPRQPPGRYRAMAADLYGAESGSVAMGLDPSRGAILGLLVRSPSLWERIQQGRLVGYVILALGAVGLLIAAERFFALGRAGLRMKAQQKDLDHPNPSNPLGHVVGVYHESRHLGLEPLVHKLDDAILRASTGFDRGLSALKILAAVAPMLGLLGTVVGMIDTFQSITLFGTGDPKLMAGGISQALITTVLGLVVAIPLVLLHSVLATRSARLTATIDEQAAGMVAEHAEAYARSKSTAAATKSSGGAAACA
ncbi:MAG: MotA/TolQ/ExbB proton channel family protein [Pseudomonadota bacterium]|nr:MotA/TolQ/ExbB proton channel family protein [Pseudomonadota bacterium]